jgi:hypothetical protein
LLHASENISVPRAKDPRHLFQKSAVKSCRIEATDKSGFKNLEGLTDPCPEDEAQNVSKP